MELIKLLKHGMKFYKLYKIKLINLMMINNNY